MASNKKSRPLGITILTILFGIGALGALASLPGSIAGTSPAEVFGAILYGPGAAIAYLIVFIVNVLLVYSFIKGNMDWGWGLAIALVAYTVINSIMSLANVHGIVASEISRLTVSSAVSAQAASIATIVTSVGLVIGIVIYLVIGYYLTRPKAKAWLGAN